MGRKKRSAYDSQRFDSIYELVLVNQQLTQQLVSLTKQLALEVERLTSDAEKSKWFESEVNRLSNHLYEIELMLGCKPTQRHLRRPKTK